MKPFWLKVSIVLVIGQWILALIVVPALAHRVNVFAWAEGDTIYVESKFAGGKKVNSAEILVLDKDGEELLSGRTNEQGEFSFKAPKPSDLKIVIVAGQGHRGEWTIRASELSYLPRQAASPTSAENIKQSHSIRADGQRPADVRHPLPGPARETAELEARIEAILDRKLKPITGMLTNMQQEGPTVEDIIAGFGYIMGLVGIAAYVHSRKKKE